MGSVKNATISDIKDWLEVAGYVHEAYEWDWTISSYSAKYLGYKNDKHVFLLGFHDDHQQPSYFVTKVVVWLARSGYIEAEFTGQVEFESDSDLDVINYIETICN